MAGARVDGKDRAANGRPVKADLAEHLREVFEEQAEILAAEEIDEDEHDYTFYAQWETPLAVVTVDARFPKEDL